MFRLSVYGITISQLIDILLSCCYAMRLFMLL
ncbi:hypothetical protein HID58_037940 [Brassica napus]|uniref:Uncharacterized protein n=1 Tax=Brassica napus TaxID=3708 RepID=A0ABQ8BP40_BRANA|nr:hypothetical protein HID58_037940 [Brassica napus]